RIEYKRTIITTQEQFENINENVKYFSGQYERGESGRFYEQYIYCDKCDDFCQEFHELLIVHDILGNELTSEQKAVSIILNQTTNYEFINIFKRDPKIAKHIMQLHKLHQIRKEEEEKEEIEKELCYKSFYELDDFWEEFNLRTAYSKTIKNKGSKSCVVLLNESGNLYLIEDEIFQKELRQNCLIINIGNFDL
ncbi:23347_t:CDS:2, partial [Dentiscutata erythropus]